MKLTDFYFEDKAQIGSHMGIPLPDGTESGEWLNVVAPDADAAVKAGRAFMLAYLRIQDDLKPLEEKCKASNNMTEYHIAINNAAADLNRQMAEEIVNGWSFDEEFTKEGLKNLLLQYRSLGDVVAAFHTAQKKELEAK